VRTREKFERKKQSHAKPAKNAKKTKDVFFAAFAPLRDTWFFSQLLRERSAGTA